VEFTSGLVPVETVAASVHGEYNGVFDLSVCTSVMLAEMIKEIAPDCLVAAVDLPSIVDFRVEFYRGLFKMLRGKPFLTTAAELREAILQDLRGTP
jgi:hypothetical protein